MTNLFKKRMEFIFDEKDVAILLSVINSHTSFDIKHVGTCGWANEPTTWFVVFKASDSNYSKIVKELVKIGTISMKYRPGGLIDLYFERD